MSHKCGSSSGPVWMECADSEWEDSLAVSLEWLSLLVPRASESLCFSDASLSAPICFRLYRRERVVSSP